MTQAKSGTHDEISLAARFQVSSKLDSTLHGIRPCISCWSFSAARGDREQLIMQNAHSNHPAVHEVTRILKEAGPGNPHASEALLPLVYEELRKLAAVRMSAEREDHTLQATALVHEAYLRLVGGDDLQWASRAHFFAAAAEAMRRILIEHARARMGPKRGGSLGKLPIDVVDLAATDDPEQILALEEAISRLEKEDVEAARVVRLRFYAGLSIEETAKALDTSASTVKRDWSFARAFLFRALEDR
jgi:RNA polymerase sigma factor (TIGR02999 family)